MSDISSVKSETLVDKKFIQHIEYLHEKSFWRNIFPKYIFYVWFWPAALIIMSTYTSYDESGDVEIQGLKWKSMQDLLKLKVEMKQYQNINLTMGNLPSFPMVNMHITNDLTNEMKQKEIERRIFENINAIKIGKEAVSSLYGWTYDQLLFVILVFFYGNEFRKSNIPNSFLLKNRILLAKRLFHHKSGFVFSIITYKFMQT